MNRTERSRAGFSLVEVIVSGFVLIVLLGLLASFLVEQQDLSGRTQARNEVQDKARVAMQIVAQDLQLSGADYYVDSTGNVAARLGDCPSVSGRETCFVAVDSDEADAFGSTYITTTRSDLTEACRLVLYRLTQNELLRVDQTTTCGAPASADPSDSDYADLFAGQILATNIVAFNIVYRCSNGVWVDSYPVAACPENSSYLRSAVVSIYASSDDEYPDAPADSFAVVVASDDGTSSTSRTVQCPADRACIGLTQEILLPNLKK